MGSIYSFASECRKKSQLLPRKLSIKKRAITWPKNKNKMWHDRPACWGICPRPVPHNRQVPEKINHTEISISYKADWPIRSGYLLILMTYLNPLFWSMLATWAQYLSRCDSLHVASSVVCTGVAEEPFSSLALSYSHYSASTSCLVDPPILPAWPISVLLKYMIDRIQTILPHHFPLFFF